MLHALSGNYMEFPRLLYSSGFRPTKIQGASINMRGCKVWEDFLSRTRKPSLRLANGRAPSGKRIEGGDLCDSLTGGLLPDDDAWRKLLL